MVFLFTLGTLITSAQDDKPERPRSEGMFPERIEKYRKMRLIEILNLNEEDAVRFMAKQTAHDNAQRELHKERSEVLDQLEKIVQTKAPEKEYAKLFDQLDQNDQKMVSERKRYQTEIKGLLSTEKMAKFMIFERNFQRELRNAMDDVRRDRRRSRPDSM